MYGITVTLLFGILASIPLICFLTIWSVILERRDHDFKSDSPAETRKAA